ncbi:MAG: poly-gamma-glutamate synthase PgsB [Deltaproteobacteria bacterium]|nr:poly-gamma-glutamate synthase PgsB [Deltaproteobacteria bacterium]
MTGVWVLFAVLVLLTGLGLSESISHRKNLAKIPIRIHVNGTRGKSSVTRLIAAGLRESGIVTCAKTTGTLARVIMPDGSEYPVFRPARPNVIEQVRIVRTAAAADAQVLVLECMAVQPYLQTISELKLVRATHGVITNARADHLDVMGPTEDDVALALAGMTPLKGKLYTGERRHLAALESASRDRETAIIATTEAEVEAVTTEDLAGFSYVEHQENIALALKVCADLGVARDVALRGMWRAKPDPGVMTVSSIDFFGRSLAFVNGFAANDPESTERIWNMSLDRFPEVEKRVAIFNCRADRADRSQQLGQACASWRPADHYLLIGTGTYIFARAAEKAGLDGAKIVFGEDRQVHEIFEMVIELIGRSGLVMGMGNIGGQGLDLVSYFKNRSILLPEPRA